MLWFGREVALWLGVVSAAVQFISAYVFELTTDQQGLLNAGVAAVAGLITAVAVHRERVLPAVTGLLQALISIAASFGWNIPPEQQSALMVLVASIGAFVVRQNVEAPVNAAGVWRTGRPADSSVIS